MKSRSSTSSSRALELPRRVPAAALLAALIVLAAEGASRLAVARGWVRPVAGIEVHVDMQLGDLLERGPDLWFLGNSTLAYGLEMPLDGPCEGVHAAKLTHGSATLAASTRMLRHYVEQGAGPPSAVLVFLTKDDLNTNGYRAEKSRRYEAIGNGPSLDLDDVIMLSAIRSRLAELPKVVYARARRAILGASAESHPKPQHFEGRPIDPGDGWYGALARDFSVEWSDFAALGETCRDLGIPVAGVVWMPTTIPYREFHDALDVPVGFASLRTLAREACSRSGLLFVEVAVPEDAYHLFRDAYHLNDRGREYFTPRFCELLRRLGLSR